MGGAAAVAGVAAGLLGPRAAHAAPVPTGGPFILGQANDANATTSLTATSSSTPNPILDVLQSNVGIGVHATAFGGTAISGDGLSGGNGLFGTSDSGSAVIAFSRTEDGLVANGGRHGAILVGKSAPLLLVPASFAGAPTSGFHGTGEVVIDSNGDMFLCVSNGMPGHWRKVAAPQYGYAGGALNLLPSAIRLLDTRAGANDANLHPGTPVAYHGTINVPAAGVTYNMQTIPTGATAVFGLLTAALAPGVNCGDGSSAIAWAAGQPRPAAVSVIFNPQDLQGAYTANFAVVPTGASGDISLFNQPINPVAVDYLFDCFGFVM
jgi:hypothetical protein